MGAPQSALRCVHREKQHGVGWGEADLGLRGHQGGPAGARRKLGPWLWVWGGGEGEARDTSWVGHGDWTGLSCPEGLEGVSPKRHWPWAASN